MSSTKLSLLVAGAMVVGVTVFACLRPAGTLVAEPDIVRLGVVKSLHVDRVHSAGIVSCYQSVYQIEVDDGTTLRTTTHELPPRGVRVGSYVYWLTWYAGDGPAQVDLVLPVQYGGTRGAD